MRLFFIATLSKKLVNGGQNGPINRFLDFIASAYVFAYRNRYLFLNLITTDKWIVIPIEVLNC